MAEQDPAEELGRELDRQIRRCDVLTAAAREAISTLRDLVARREFSRFSRYDRMRVQAVVNQLKRAVEDLL